MAVWSEVMLSDLAGARRLDAEYYDPQLLRYESEVHASPFTVKPLGQLVKHGYRVVYESTTILDREDAPADAVRFLQAANVSGRLPVIHDHGIGWVHRADWDRYPKGRIHPGEILVEVKGKAEKVAIVPDDFPTETLVTGTLFKFQVDEAQIDRFVLLAYLLSRYGCGFRHRCLTNTLIGFVSKGELYDIPVPILTPKQQQAIRSRVEGSLTAERQSRDHYAEAEALLESALGLDKLDLAPRLFYERPYADVQTAARFDAEYFQPPKTAVLNALAKMPGQPLRDQFRSIRQLWQPDRASVADHVRNYDLTDALQPFLDETVEPATRETIASTKKKLKPGDLVVSRLRSYLKEIAVVLDSGSVPVVGSTEFIVLRPQQGATRVEALLVYLRSRHVQTVLKWCQDGSNHPRFHEDELLNLRVPKVIRDTQDAIASKVEASINARREARRLLDEAKAMVEVAILGAKGS